MENTHNATLNIYFGKRLKEKRKKLGITLFDIAKKLGTSHQQIQKYENAQCRVSAEKMYQIASFLGVDLNYFFHGYETYFKNHIQGVNQGEEASIHHQTNILIVENDPQEEAWIRAVLGTNIKKRKVFSVHEPKQALTFLRYKPTTLECVIPDIILLSFDFPEQEGQWLLREIKRDRLLKPIPVIILSHNKNYKEISNTYNLGAAGYIYKDSRIDEFQKTVKKAVEYWLYTVCSPTGYVEEQP